ncbi:S9 family peptidase [Reyranella sp.]|jgi:oligopeptidase B|uniref:S9 family peptidase n=1 Tax=Reyranella sp. TaxID=1929291 RepID=UPI000BC86467|nr:S9 family peptidase [Reyranella sp.]OYY46876.1 MAG: S9 family peptidase [Rhodospirillales bacterium 35-66-84]OYZ96896.1 MAG: S9 family peptidase [Rhodospirillales bacterium 24-66-33]OZB27775.1 MAG: S9 family peptidase [Rhodospirillales bacterium 39-66-50]HQS13793.1 S9 family peptidase [Reyranella sp.]HQT10278.1 S9 family peptidase [Reyranella sp.]
MKPPIAPRHPSRRTLHGVTITDDYAWLKDEKWQEVLRDPSLLDPEIRAYVEAENAYAEERLGPTQALQKVLVAEMRGRIKEDDAGVPTPDGPFSYLWKFREGGQHQQIGRTPRNGGEMQTILDGDALAKQSDYFKFGGTRHSPDHRLEAWSADLRGSEYFTLRIRRWDTAEDLPDILTETSGSVVWGRDSSFFFYVRVDDNHRPLKVYRHVLGTAQADDVLVYEEKDVGWFTRIGKSASGRFCVISGGDHDTTEQWLIDLSSPDAEPRLIAPREKGVRYSVADRGDELFILTNEGGAIDFRIVTAPLAAPQRANWRELVPHRPGTYILDIELFAGHLARLERANALPSIVIRDLASGEEHAIAFDEAAYALDMSGGYEFDTTTLRFVYSSMTTPSEVYDYDMATQERTLRKRQVIPSGHDPADYVTTRITATAHDGAEVRVSILHRRDLVRDGRAPLLLYGYGSYGMSMPASFSANRLSLVDRGFVYAIAHIRGGSDQGWSWYLDGKREKKTNTFDDFVAAGRALIEAGYTSAGRIVGHGGSAGGMLMGAVANRAPELFAGILAEVPFVDVLATMLDDKLPLTPPEWPEWGNPITDAAAFNYIRSYSPYDNVTAQRYPAILAMAGLTDPRVTYWEPAKWVARLRATMTGGGPVILHTNMGAGHGGASGRFSRLDEVAIGYAFALDTVGLAGAKP